MTDTVMQIISHAPEIIGSIATLIVVLMQFNKGIAKVWKQTPGTPDTEIFTRFGQVLHRMQKIVGFFGGDTAKDERQRDLRRL